MSVESHIRPLAHHSLGIPHQIVVGMRRMSVTGTPRLVTLALRTYEQLLSFIEAGLEGKGLKGGIPIEHEQDAADYVAHLIIDAAYVHGCLRAAGYTLVGDFPYDHLADRILPILPKGTHSDADNKGV